MNWARTVRNLCAPQFLPEWGERTLADMSQSRAEVRDWHLELSKTVPATADHCAAIIRATYRHMLKLHDGLPAAWPTLAVKWVGHKPKQVAITDWQAWATAWRAIPDPKRRAFALANLLLGSRPGELSRVTADDVNLKARTLTFRQAKAGEDYVVPLSWPILRCLRHVDGFSSARHNAWRDGLPLWGKPSGIRTPLCAQNWKSTKSFGTCCSVTGSRELAKATLRALCCKRASDCLAQAKISQIIRRLGLDASALSI